MIKYIFFFSLSCFLCLLFPSLEKARAEDSSLSLSTYYPIPYGKYDTLKSQRLMVGKFEEDNSSTPEDETITKEDIGEGAIYVEKGLVLRRLTELPATGDYQPGSMIYYRPDEEGKGHFRFLVDNKWEKIPSFPIAYLYVKAQGNISGQRGWICGKYYNDTWSSWIPCILRPGVSDNQGAVGTFAINRSCTVDSCQLKSNGSTTGSSNWMQVQVQVPENLREYFSHTVTCPQNVYAGGSISACQGCSSPPSYGWTNNVFSVSGTSYCRQGSGCGCCSCSWGCSVPVRFTLDYEGFDD